MAANEGSSDAQRFRNGLPADATLEDKKAFAIHCFKNYDKQNWHGDSLSEYFADDFNGFSIEDFAAFDSDTRRNLLDFLRRRGVFVPKGRNIIIAHSLHQVVKEEIPWPENDPDKPLSQRPTRADGSNGQGQPSKLREGSPPHGTVDQDQQINKEDGDSAAIDTSTRSYNQFQRRGNMTNLLKAYSNNFDKYSGATTDNFERKFMLFLERCDQADIPNEDRHRAFSIMLNGKARQYYFDTLKSKQLDLLALEKAIKLRFQTPERTRALLQEWETLTLKSVFSSNQTKSPSQCLESLIEKLSDIQTSLPNEYRNETILRNKLLNAVRDVESCQLGYHKPADTVQGVISDLHASLATINISDAPTSGPSAHLVDRRYVKTENGRKRGGPGHQKKCFVCNRPGCRSTNHSTKERLKAYRENKALRQFIATLAPDEESDEEEREAANAVEEIMTHVLNVQNSEEGDDEKLDQSFSYISKIDDKDTDASFTAQLNDAIFMHTLTSQMPNVRFGGKFKGVMIDTGAARGSSAGKLQFEAYCSATGNKAYVDKARAAECHFGIGSATSMGIARISFPLGPYWLSFDAYILDTDSPIIMSIDDMDRLGSYLNNLENALVQPETGLKVGVKRIDDILFSNGIHWFHVFSQLSNCDDSIDSSGTCRQRN